MTAGRQTQLPAMPDFKAFAETRLTLQVLRPDVLDAAETRMASCLAIELAEPQDLACPEVGYRCHVAEDWLVCFGLPADWKPRALVSQGVRHSLQTLFTHWAQTGRRVALPSDVYPVYRELAEKADLVVTTYASYPTMPVDFAHDADITLVTDPFKPRGSAVSERELQQLLAWLAASTQRRVVVDAVYQFDTRLSETTRRLLDTGQVIVLHSLAKAWASPLLAGIALVPEQDVQELTAVFRLLSVDRSRLALAQGMLRSDRMRPAHLADVLAGHQTALARALTQRGLSLPAREVLPGQYLFVVEQSWTTLLHTHKVLALPLSVFGSRVDGVSVLSSLPPLPPR